MRGPLCGKAPLKYQVLHEASRATGCSRCPKPLLTLSPTPPQAAPALEPVPLLLLCPCYQKGTAMKSDPCITIKDSAGQTLKRGPARMASWVPCPRPQLQRVKGWSDSTTGQENHLRTCVFTHTSGCWLGSPPLANWPEHRHMASPGHCLGFLAAGFQQQVSSGIQVEDVLSCTT